MSTQVVDLTCGGCGAALAPAEVKCKFCGRAIVISSFNSITQMTMPDLKNAVAEYQKGNCASAVSGGEANSAPSDGSINFSMACCYLKLKFYDKALEKFEAAIEDNFDNSETYFYAALSLLKGKKAYLTPMNSIKKAIEYVDAALAIENRGIYSYFLAYLKYDFFFRKSLRVQPSYLDELNQAVANGVSQFDIDQLFALLGVDKIERLAI